ncbi:hypothetical protein EMPS_09747 [Entomortierella parvispora]|uniref:Glycosyltransferase 61 catalytic domain-containing protein n=1 Tax=Entomortierella parvispora TaxID=205924 RepID=A0A9P3HJ58_9FUNG|nr:hypothetical protein EMPS_09747 [Entomortierella parvispora]
MPPSSYQLLPLSSSPADKAPSSSGHVRTFTSLISRTRRRFILVLLIFAISFILLLSIGMSSGDDWRGGTAAYDFELPEGSWTCTDDGLSDAAKSTEYNKRSRQCVVENLCVDRKGAFIRSNGFHRQNMPEVNLMSADQPSDFFWQPRLKRYFGRSIRAHYVNETLFVHSLYSPYHFSHWLYNGMTPLYSTVKRFGGTKNSWLLRATRYHSDIDHQGTWEMDHFFQTGKELVLNKAEISTPFQSLPPSDAPICFRRAVIGLGSQCALSYCENNIPTEVYQTFREEVADYYWRTPETWQKHLTNAQYAIDNGMEHQDHGHKKRWLPEKEHKGVAVAPISKRKDAAEHVTNTQLRCLQTARYYNFERAGPNHGLEQGELRSRFGQLKPDEADPEADYENLVASGDSNTQGGKRQLVVGILQREESRRLVNVDDLIDGLVKAGFRVKWMSFDHGCGFAETAYLFRDINVLISPHGNAIGASIFMPSQDPVPTIISVDNSRHWEGWFKFTATVLGQRFVHTICGPHEFLDEAQKEICGPQYRDLDTANWLLNVVGLVLGVPDAMVKSDKEIQEKGLSRGKVLNGYRKYVKSHPEAQRLAQEELEIMIGPNPPFELMQKYGDQSWLFQDEYWKVATRYIDVGRTVKFILGLQADKDLETLSTTSPQQAYMDYVRKGKACGFQGCADILTRNVANMSTSAFGKHSVDDTSRWGQPTRESESLHQGFTPEVLNMLWKID